MATNRLSYKQVSENVDNVAEKLGVKGYLHLTSAYGYYQLQMYYVDDKGEKTTGVTNLYSGSLMEINIGLNFFGMLTYEANKVKERLSVKQQHTASE